MHQRQIRARSTGWTSTAIQGVVYLMLTLAYSCAFASNGSNQESKPMQSYNVGRISTDWQLSPGTPSAQRLQVEWWYPTNATQGGPDYLFSQELKSALVTYMGMPSFAISKKEKGVGLRGVEPATGTFPVVVFSHGFASFSRQNNRQAEALAAAGFIVASLSHPEHSLTTEYASGDVVGIDASHPGLQMMGKGVDKKRVAALMETTNEIYVQLAAATSVETHQAAMEALRTRSMFSLYLGSAERRVSDLVGFVESLLAQEQAASAADIGSLLSHLNLEQIGLYGHSLGGVVAVAAAQQLGFRQRSREVGQEVGQEVDEEVGEENSQDVVVGGVLSLDVPQFILPATSPTQLIGNGCFLMGGDTKAAGTRLQGINLNRFLATANPGFCEINIADAAHQNFTDLSWVTPLKWFGQLGSVSNKKFGRWLNGFVVAYMQHHLQGKPYDYATWPDAQVTGNIERP